MNQRNKIIWSIILGIVPLIWTILSFISGSTRGFEDWLTDFRHRVFNPNHQVTDQIVIVDIDEDSVNRYGNNERYGRWPWKRNVYPEILSYIASGQPKGILFDIMFFGESPEDDEFAQSNMVIPMISHAISFQNQPNFDSSTQYTDFIENQATNLEEKQGSVIDYNKVNLPIGNIGFTSPNLHSVTYKSDPDGLSRRYWLYFEYKKKFYPSLAMRAISMAYPIEKISHSQNEMKIQFQSGKTTRVPLEKGKYQLNFYPKVEIYDSYRLKRIPIAWVIESIRDMEAGRFASFEELKIQPANYRDKIIFPKKLRSKLTIPDHLKDKVVIAEDVAGTVYIPEEMKGLIILPIDYIREIEIPKKIQSKVFVPEDIVTPDTFKDKIVLIGTSAAATYDTKIIPYGKIPGVAIHAMAVSNIIQKDFLIKIPRWITLITVIIMTVISGTLLIISKSAFSRILIPLAFIFSYFSLSFGLFKNDYVLNLALFIISYPVSFTLYLAYMIFIEGAEKRKYSKVLGNMVDPTIVSEALNDLEALKKGGEKEITAFFSDVASFSTISEQLTSEQLAALLNEYLSAMTIILKNHRGTLDKYIGDAIVGIFGAPVETNDHFIDAAKASLEMFEKLEELKTYWKANNMYIDDARNMNFRIGLNTGIAKVGFMGTDTLASYTMMGDTVNLAARLEAAGKDYGVNILISEMTNSHIKEQMYTKLLDAVVVKGKTEPVRIFELISEKGKAPQNIVEATELYEEAFQLHLDRQFKKAIQKFQESQTAKGSKDKAVGQLIERCEIYLTDPPPENWNGAFIRTHK